MPCPAGPTSEALDPRQFATLGSEAELRDAVSGWLYKLREFFGPKQGDGRVRLTVLFASCCHSEVDLHNAVMAMGVTVLSGTRRGAAAKHITAEPPFAVVTGDFSQPGLDITYCNSPKQVLSVQVQNRGEGKVVMHATRPLFEAHIEELLLFFGPVTEIRGPEPKATAPGLLSAPVQRLSARELLRQPRSASGDGS